MQIFRVFLFAFSPFLTGFRQNSLSFLGTTRKIEFCPFFHSKCEILFSSVFLLFSLLFFSSTRPKRGEEGQEKISVLFFDTLPSHEREKEEKIHHTLRRKKRFFLKRFERLLLLLLERTKLRALE